MKHIVDEIVRALSPQELRELKYFLNAGTENREDLKMLAQIRDGETTASRNINADHQTRKRLKKKIVQFAMLENLRHDRFSQILSMMETAKYLFRKNLHPQAWDYLLKAEQMAIQAEEYRLLDHNYDLQISHSYNVATHPPQAFRCRCCCRNGKTIEL